MRFCFSSFRILTLGFIAMSSMAEAGTTHCSDANRTAQYTASRPDGGANQGNDINWVIDGVNFMEESSMEIVAPGGNGFQRPSQQVTSEFSQDVVLNRMTNGDYEVITSALLAKVSKISSQELIYEGYLICKFSRYVGYPRP